MSEAHTSGNIVPQPMFSMNIQMLMNMKCKDGSRQEQTQVVVPRALQLCSGGIRAHGSQSGKSIEVWLRQQPLHPPMRCTCITGPP